MDNFLLICSKTPKKGTATFTTLPKLSNINSNFNFVSRNFVNLYSLLVTHAVQRIFHYSLLSYLQGNLFCINVFA